VNHCLDNEMAQEFQQRSDIVASFEPVSGEGMGKTGADVVVVNELFDPDGAGLSVVKAAIAGAQSFAKLLDQLGFPVLHGEVFRLCGEFSRRIWFAFGCKILYSFLFRVHHPSDLKLNSIYFISNPYDILE
jgi:hypothetical protein